MRTLVLTLGLLATPLAAQTQQEMNAQAGAAWQRADAAMTAQWKRTLAYMKRMDATAGGGFGYAGALLESQRAWLKYRDRQCWIESGEFAGGSLASMTRAGCLRRLTGERTRQLKDLMWKR